MNRHGRQRHSARCLPWLCLLFVSSRHISKLNQASLDTYPQLLPCSSEPPPIDLRIMSTLHDFDASDEPPPPAYEFTQQEFDQKISHALEQSRAAVDEGEWEVWDEAAFAAAAAALTVSDNSTPAVAGASSSRSPPPPRPALASSSFPSSHNGDGRSNYSNEEGTATQPLRIVKKSREPSVKEKERPSWYADAGLDGHQRSASTSSRQRAPNSLHVANSLPNHSTEPVHLEEDREPTPPPMFEAVGPSLEGPPYEGYGEPQPQQPGLVMAYAPGDSRPASPLQSPTTSPTLTQVYVSSPPPLIQPLPGRRTLPVPPSRSPVPASLPRELREQQHLSVPQPPRPSGHRPNLRPTASYRDSLKSKSYVPPRVAFDPRIAYGEKDRSSYYDVPEGSPPPDIDPASFYTYVHAKRSTSSV